MGGLPKLQQRPLFKSGSATMTSPNIATATQPFALIARKHRDGSVLLSAANDRIFKLNGVGALTWAVLEQSASPLSVDDVVQELCTQFARLNASGEMQYEVSAAQLRQDTSRFIKSLAESGLLQVVDDVSRGECYRIKGDVSGTTSTTLAETTSTTLSDATTTPAKTPGAETPLCISPASTASAFDSESRPKKRETLIAFVGLFAFDLLLRFRGFEALIKKVENWPTTKPHKTDANTAETCRHVCAMVNRAQVYYPKKAMCLQHSAVVTCLLRREGVPAEMVLAAQEFPPKGHAWVEFAGMVVNDKPTVREIYRTLRRV